MTFNAGTTSRTASIAQPASGRDQRSAMTNEMKDDDENSSIATNLEPSTSSSSTSLSKYVNPDVSPKSRTGRVVSEPRASTATLTDHHDIIDEVDDDEATMTKPQQTAHSRSSSSSSNSNVSNEERQSVLEKSATTPASSSSASASEEHTRHLITKTAVARTLRVKADETTANSRYSPASLERLLNINMNYLDTLNVSAVQLEELDKVRCVGRAQQETVALAYLLKVLHSFKRSNNLLSFYF